MASTLSGVDENAVIYGPLNVRLIETGSPDVIHAAFNSWEDAYVKLSSGKEQKERQLEDGRKLKYSTGMNGVLEIECSEINTTLTDDIEDNKALIDQVEIDCINIAKTLTLGNIDDVDVDLIDGFKLKITVYFSLAAGSAISDFLSIAATP